MASFPSALGDRGAPAGARDDTPAGALRPTAAPGGRSDDSLPATASRQDGIDAPTRSPSGDAAPTRTERPAAGPPGNGIDGAPPALADNRRTPFASDPELEQALRDAIGCFVAGTGVRTPAGSRAIESIEAGDVVFAYHEGRREVVSGKVLQTFVRQVPVVVDLHVRFAEDPEERVVTGTANHPFYLPERDEYAAMAHLVPGDVLQTFDGLRAYVVSLHVRRGDFAVFNFTVEGEHNYFVLGSNDPPTSILVHNQDNGDGHRGGGHPCAQGQGARTNHSGPIDASTNARRDQPHAETPGEAHARNASQQTPTRDTPASEPRAHPLDAAAAPAVTGRERFAMDEWERLRNDSQHPYRPRRMTREEFIARYADGQELSPPPNRRWIRPGGREVAPEPRFSTETPDQVLGTLRGGSFGPFERMLSNLGIATPDTVRAQFEGPDAIRTQGRTHTVVRHELKGRFRAEVIARLTGVNADGTPRPGHRAEVQGRHPDLDWAGDPDGAYAAGRHLDFLRATEGLDGSDKGNLYEVFDRAVHRAGQHAEAHPRIERGTFGPDATSSRIPDNLIPVPSTDGDHVVLHDDKNYTGPLTEHALGQIGDYGTLRDRRIGIAVGGTTRNVVVDGVLITFPDPRGVTANAENIRKLLRETTEGLSFEVFNWRGESARIPGPELGADFTDEELAEFIGPAPEWARSSGTSGGEDSR